MIKMHYQLDIKKSFAKDEKKLNLSKSHHAKLYIYIGQLLNKQPLPKAARDHQLSGEYRHCREFHLGGDLLVIYQIKHNTLYLARIDSHAQLFK